MVANNNEFERRLWATADELRANSGLKASEYSTPVLGLIFLRYADYKFTESEKKLAGQGGTRHKIAKEDYQAQGIIYVPDNARFQKILALPEGFLNGGVVDEAMKSIAAENAGLKDILPKNFNAIENTTLKELLKLVSSVPVDEEGDIFGKIYEYFLGEFAASEGAKGGEFYTPTSLVKLIVEIIRLCKMNMAVHGLEGDIRESNTYYENVHDSVGKFDFVMANAPFNVDKVDKDRLKDDKRFPLGLPKSDNANYLWIQIFYSALNARGRSGFVMANSAADARSSELEIRQKLIENKVVDVIVSIGPNFFYTVTLPCTLWFLDKGKKNTERAENVLFLDARSIFSQFDRVHREFAPQQIEYLSNIVRLYRGEETEDSFDSADLLAEKFQGGYQDIPGLCKVATSKEIEGQGWSLNPGRYVGVAKGEPDEFDFKERLEELNEELEKLNVEAHELEGRIAENVGVLIR